MYNGLAAAKQQDRETYCLMPSRLGDFRNRSFGLSFWEDNPKKVDIMKNYLLYSCSSKSLILRSNSCIRSALHLGHSKCSPSM